MTAQLKNRLIGTIVLVAVGVIFIPDLLDGDKRRLQHEFNPIAFTPEQHPLPPLLIEFDESATDGKPLVSDELSSELIAQHGEKPLTPALDEARAAERATPNKPEETSLEQSKALPTGAAYILQLGSFKNAQNVQRLLNTLHEAGIDAQSYPSPPIEGEINRVFVGPNVSKVQLEDQQERLSQLTGLNGRVVVFDPLFSDP